MECRYRFRLTWSIALLMLGAVGVAAQISQTFEVSGFWPPRSNRTQIFRWRYQSGKTSCETTVRGEPMEPFFRDITVGRQFETGTGSENHRIGVQGGTVAGRHADGSSNGRLTYHAVTWAGDALTFQSSRNEPDSGPTSGLNAVRPGRSILMVASALLSRLAAREIARGSHGDVSEAVRHGRVNNWSAGPW